MWLKKLLARAIAPIDPPLLVIALALMAIGLVTLFSASGEDQTKVLDQVRNMAVALLAMWVVAGVSPQHLARIAVPMYLLGLILLAGVALFGEVSHGARRWLHVGVGRIQPSELMKIALPLMLAWFFEKCEQHVRLIDFAVAAGLLGVPVAFIAKQPDLGTALLISASGFYVMFLAGLGWRVILGLTALAGVSLPLVWSVLHDYQRKRILTLLDPTQDPLGAGYHTIQSTIAVGSGGLSGKGWLAGTQAHLDFLPERTTDFIFAVFAEEFGLVGILVLLVLLLLLTGRGLMIAANGTTPFMRLAGAGLTLTLFTYAFVNMGMVSGILPVVGVPLPFLSYGGTSMVTILLGLGILMSIQHYRKIGSS